MCVGNSCIIFGPLFGQLQIWKDEKGMVIRKAVNSQITIHLCQNVGPSILPFNAVFLNGGTDPYCSISKETFKQVRISSPPENSEILQ